MTVDRARALSFRYVHDVVTIAFLGLGFAFIYGPESRFSAPSWEPLLDMTCGQSWPWGVAVGSAGALMLLFHDRPKVDGAAIFVGMAWCWCLVALFLIAIVRDQRASTTGIVAYSLIALIAVALLAQVARDIPPLRLVERLLRRTGR